MYSLSRIMSLSIEVLVLGAEGTGKTLLMKRLQKIIPDNLLFSTFNSIPATVSTVGTNLTTITWNKKKYEFRELGGPMAPIWKNYYSSADCVVFLVDTSNLMQISASCILFFDMLISDKLRQVPVLLLLNKTDLPVGFKQKEILSLLRINELTGHCGRNIEVLETSLGTGDGLKLVVDWLQVISPLNDSGKT